MTDSPYLMGIDFGTGGVRVGIFDRDGGPVSFSATEFEIHHPRPGWAEQDPDEWWSALAKAVPQALAEGDVSPAEIAGISVDATSSTVLAVGADGRPLRPAIMWMDVRASEQADRVAGTAHPALKYNGHGAVSAEWGLPKALWIRDCEPEVYERARFILDCVDWVTQRLTATSTASINTAACKYYFDRDAGGWPAELYEKAGAPDLVEKLPRDVLDVGAPVGGVCREVAQELGLEPDTPVAEGSVDAYAGALGLGVVEPGTLALITGSSHVIIAQSAEPVHDPGFWGAYTDAIIPGLYTIEAGQASTGSIVAWFARRLAAGVGQEAERAGADVYHLLAEMAREVPIGSDGLLVLDYFQGNRSPHTDPRARGAISGLSLSHGPGHLFRAIIEGICYGTEDILETMRSRDTSLKAASSREAPPRATCGCRCTPTCQTCRSPFRGSAKGRCSVRRSKRASGRASIPISPLRPRTWCGSSGRSSPTGDATRSTGSGCNATASCTPPFGTCSTRWSGTSAVNQGEPEAGSVHG